MNYELRKSGSQEDWVQKAPHDQQGRQTFWNPGADLLASSIYPYLV